MNICAESITLDWLDILFLSFINDHCQILLLMWGGLWAGSWFLTAPHPSLMVWIKPIWGWGDILLAIVSLFHFFRSIQHPEKWSVSFKNFFRKCECFKSCYLPVSSNLLKKKSLRKTSLLMLFELLPAGLLKYVWPLVTA